MFKNRRLAVLLCCLVAAAACAAEDKPKPVKIYLMAGQSNMQGKATYAGAVQEANPDLAKPRDDVWCVYAGQVSGPLRPGWGGSPSNEKAFGPELVMGKVLGDAVDNPIILFKSATGGTTLNLQWRPPSAVRRAGGEVGFLYKRMMRRFHRLLANIEDFYPQYSGQGFEVAGFVWFQGENDSLAEATPNDRSTGYWHHYEKNLKDLIHDVRAELAIDKLPVLIIQINDCPVWERKSGGKVIRAAQKKVAEEDPLATWIPTADLHPLAHYNSRSMITIGDRAGKALLPFARTVVEQNASETLAQGKAYLENPRPAKAGGNTAQLADGLVAYWSFDEEAGPTVKDRRGGADGKCVGNPKRVEGVIGRSVLLAKGQKIEFLGYRDVVAPSGNIENLALSYWYRANRYGAGRIGKGTGKPVERNGSNWFYSRTANVFGWDATCIGTKGGVFFTAGFDGGTKGFKFNGGPGNVISDGYEWNHVVITYEGAGKSFEIYINGLKAPKGGKVRQGVGQLDRPFHGIQKENHILPARDAVLTIGGSIELDRQFEGFDEVGIWSRALSEKEALRLCNNGSGVSLAR
jgi:alpha-galactosidase